MEMLCDWNSYVAFHVGKVQATCSISSVVDLQNLLGTTLVLRVVLNLKTKPTPTSSLLSIQPKSQPSTLTLSLQSSSSPASVPPHCQPCPTVLPGWLHPCPRQDHLRVWVGCTELLLSAFNTKLQILPWIQVCEFINIQFIIHVWIHYSNLIYDSLEFIKTN